MELFIPALYSKSLKKYSHLLFVFFAGSFFLTVSPVREVWLVRGEEVLGVGGFCRGVARSTITTARCSSLHQTALVTPFPLIAGYSSISSPSWQALLSRHTDLTSTPYCAWCSPVSWWTNRSLRSIRAIGA